MIDTHCHLNDREAFPDPSLTLTEAQEAGVDRVIVVGVDAESSRGALDLAEQHEGVFAIVGWHPNYTSSYTSKDLNQIETMLEHPKAVAIGEIGLDFHWQYATREQQDRALFDQLGLAAATGKPVVFHCREAYDALLAILETRPVLPYLFHCFAGDLEHAKRAIAMDSYFGVDGPITYKKSSLLRDVMRSLPQDRIVVETDSPYLTPEPYRGKPNRPAYVTFVNAALASTLGMEPAACEQMTTANAERFFRL